MLTTHFFPNIFLLCLFMYCRSGDTYYLDRDEVYKLMETTFEMVRKQMKSIGFHTVVLPDIQYQVDQKTVKGSQGVLTGLDEFTSKTLVTLEPSSSKYETEIRWSTLETTYVLSQDGLKNTTEMNVNFLETLVNLTISFNKESQIATMEKFDIVFKAEIPKWIGNTMAPFYYLGQLSDFREVERNIKESIKYVLDTGVKKMIVLCIEKAKFIKAPKTGTDEEHPCGILNANFY